VREPLLVDKKASTAVGPDGEALNVPAVIGPVFVVELLVELVLVLEVELELVLGIPLPMPNGKLVASCAPEKDKRVAP